MAKPTSTKPEQFTLEDITKQLQDMDAKRAELLERSREIAKQQSESVKRKIAELLDAAAVMVQQIVTATGEQFDWSDPQYAGILEPIGLSSKVPKKPELDLIFAKRVMDFLLNQKTPVDIKQLVVGMKSPDGTTTYSLPTVRVKLPVVVEHGLVTVTKRGRLNLYEHKEGAILPE